MLGLLLGLSESAANYIFHQESNIFRELLPASLLEQVKNDSKWQGVCKILSKIELRGDSYEQQI
jgi:hypothetical protein